MGKRWPSHLWISQSLNRFRLLSSPSSWAAVARRERLKSQLLPGTTTTRTIGPSKAWNAIAPIRRPINMPESSRNHSPKPSIAISGPLSVGSLKTMAKLLRRPSSYMKVCNRDRSEFGLYCPSTSRESIVMWYFHLKTTMSPLWKRKNAFLATFMTRPASV